MDVLDCINTRRAITQFEQKPIEKEKIGILLDAAHMAPSSGNLQNWRFIIVQDHALKEKVATACYDQLWMTEAPIYIVVCADLEKLRRFYGNRGENLYAVQNCAVCAQNILLAATELGLGSNFVSNFDDEYIAALLNLPESARVQCVIPIGYTLQNPDVPIRYQLETLVYWDSWGKVWEDWEHILVHHGGYHRKYAEKAIEAAGNVNKTIEKNSKGLFDSIKEKLANKKKYKE